MKTLAVLIAACSLGACAVTVDESSLIPDLKEPGSDVTLTIPEGYQRSDRLVPVGDLGVVHTVRLDRPDSETTILFAGGSGYFSAKASKRIGRLAELTGADIITFDYPGRSGTTVPRTSEALVEMGPALVSEFRRTGWIGTGPVYAYGFSFGGASASNMARTGGFAGLILESTSSDIAAMGRNMIPALMRPALRLRIDESLEAFDFFGFAVSAQTPILVLAAREDTQADLETVSRFAERLKASGATVTLIETPGGHGDALYSAEVDEAVRKFVSPAP